MHIVLAFYGIDRHRQLGFSSVESALLCKLPSGSQITVVDIMSELECISNLRSNESDITLQAPLPVSSNTLQLPSSQILHVRYPHLDRSSLLSFYNLNIDQLSDPFKDNHSSTLNILNQLHLLNLCASHIPRNADLVIACRNDILFHSLSEHLVHYVLDRCLRGYVVLPYYQFNNGVNDRIFFATYDIAQKLLQRIGLIYIYLNQRHYFNSEHFLHFVLRRLRLKFLGVPIRTNRIRSNSILASERKLLISSNLKRSFAAISSAAYFHIDLFFHPSLHDKNTYLGPG